MSSIFLDISGNNNPTDVQPKVCLIRASAGKLPGGEIPRPGRKVHAHDSRHPVPDRRMETPPCLTMKFYWEIIADNLSKRG
jgi:hypothetical protein